MLAIRCSIHVHVPDAAFCLAQEKSAAGEYERRVELIDQASTFLAINEITLVQPFMSGRLSEVSRKVYYQAEPPCFKSFNKGSAYLPLKLNVRNDGRTTDTVSSANHGREDLGR
jgi:hypothetical protein